MARVFAVMADFNALTECRGTSLDGKHKVVRVTKLAERTLAQRWRRKTVSKPESNPGVEFKLHADAGIRV
jgi:hypothetical protein